MKLQIVKDGEIQGSFVATAITVFIFLMILFGFIFETIRVGWEKFGSLVMTTYLGQLGIWLGYKGIKSIWSPQQQLPEQLGQMAGPIIVEPLAKAMGQKKEEVVVDLDK
jgi:hypothetical protein